MCRRKKHLTYPAIKPHLALCLLTTWLAVSTNVFAQTGTLSFIKIVAGASGDAAEIGSVTLTTDETLTVHAAGYDTGGNYLGDQTVTWSVSGGIGTLSPTTGVTTTLSANAPGSGSIIADHATATDDITGTITVTAGAAHHVKVLSGPSGHSTEVTAVTLTSGEILTVHAGGFDADDNYIGDVTVTWSVTGGIGTLNPAAGISTLFTAIRAGSGIINADHATLIDDATGTITVTASTLSYVKIIEGAAGNGPELGAKTLTTDQTLSVHAAGYDAGGNYLGDLNVSWSVSGGIGSLSAATGTTTILNATTPGTGIITADHPTATDDVSGRITVNAGAAHHVKILSGFNGNTAEVDAMTLTSGQALVLHTSAFDADDNYLADVNVAWSISGGIGTLTPATGVSTTFTATNLGTGVISADHATLLDDATGSITVVAGTLSYIKIVAGVSGNTQEVGTVTLTTDQTLTVHAAGYDAAGNYLGDQAVTWSIGGNIGVLSSTSGISTTLDAKAPGVGYLAADHATATDDVSGTITVNVGAPHHVKILSGALGATEEVTTVTLVSGQSLVVHASAFDADDNYISDVSVTWSVSGGIGTLSAATGISTVFTANSAGGGVITADHPTLLDDTTGQITVLSGALSFIKIVEGAAGNGPELGAKALTTDQTLAVHAAGYDASGNYLGDFSVGWSVSGGIGVLSNTVGAAMVFAANIPGTGFITADHATAVDDVSGTITVSLGTAHHVKVLSGASGATPEIAAVTLAIGATLVVHAGSFDTDGNYISDVTVDWSLSGGIGNLSSITGMSTVFTATTAGAGVITADHATLIDDATGTITVSPSTQVDTNLLSGAPQHFNLLPNYPNPFHAGIATTRIGYELPVNSPVKISIHNLSGQLVRVLFEGQQNAGRYTVAWDGKTIAGENVANGVYLIRLESAKFVAARKMVVAK